MPDPAALLVIESWPQAIVAVTLIGAFMVWPGVAAWLNTKKTQNSTDVIRKQLTETNGGSHVKDQLNSIVASLETMYEWKQGHTEWSNETMLEMAARFVAVERAHQSNAALLSKILRRMEQVEEIVTTPGGD